MRKNIAEIYLLGFLLFLGFLIQILSVVFKPLVILAGVAVAVFLIYKLYCNWYYESDKFKKIKDLISDNTKKCNDLDDHIQGLKEISQNFRITEYGKGKLIDNSVYNLKRKEWGCEIKNNQTYNCSLAICKNANNQPFKYLCKYFNVKPTEETLAFMESMLNNFAAAEQGKALLKKERDSIIKNIKGSIPSLIYDHDKERLIRNLGFRDIDFSDLYFPTYTFQYVSAGGNSSAQSEIKLDVENLDKFIDYLSSLLEFEKSIKGQRALMTTKLREKIKARDNYSCKKCGLSINDEPNLLLEIDHIIPLSRGGITSEDNLQTLCWKCNRSKGSKIVEP